LTGAVRAHATNATNATSAANGVGTQSASPHLVCKPFAMTSTPSLQNDSLAWSKWAFMKAGKAAVSTQVARRVCPQAATANGLSSAGSGAIVTRFLLPEVPAAHVGSTNASMTAWAFATSAAHSVAEPAPGAAQL
jgi:hypothetical protein